MQSIAISGVGIFAINVAFKNRYPGTYMLVLLPHTHILVNTIGAELLPSLILTALWSLYLNILCMPLYIQLGPYLLLDIYLPLLLVKAHKYIFRYIKHNRKKYGDSDIRAKVMENVFLTVQTVIWDWPLLIWMHVCSLVGFRALSPFISILDDDIAIGSLPLTAHDTKILATAPNHVGCIVNLCRESYGALKYYQKYKLMYLPLPTADYCEPAYKQVIETVAAMRAYLRSSQRLYSGSSSGADGDIDVDGGGSGSGGGTSTAKEEDGPIKKRIFVHCKAGRGRSVCIVLCYYLVQHAEQLVKKFHSDNTSTGKSSSDSIAVIRLNVPECFRKIQNCRSMAVMRMSVVKQFVTELENVGGSFDRMVITNAKNRTDKAYKTTLG